MNVSAPRVDPRWQRLLALFEQVLTLDESARAAWIESLDGEDSLLRAELARLLAADACTSTLDERLRATIDRELAVLTGELVADVPADWLGRRVGPYRLTRLLGSGGHGAVFLGERVEGGFEQTVAIKLVLDSIADPYTRQRFVAERRILARLQHPRIARLYDGGLDAEGRPWFAMEPVEGEPITRACDARQLSLPARIELFMAVCEGVDFAHRQLVAHLDLKPGNMLVRGDGRPMLLDFGIARLLGEAGEDGTLPQPLTPEYAAPEQLAGRPAGIASDVYALGAVLFELLTGQRSFVDPRGERTVPVASARFVESSEDAPARAAARGGTPRTLRHALSGDLDPILGKALAVDPGQRYASVAALAADLRRWRGRYPISLRRGRGYRLRRFVQRNRLGVALGSLATLALSGTTAVAMWQAHVARHEQVVGNAVRNFMVETFVEADPAHTPNAPISARALLDSGARRLHGRFVDEPEIRIALLVALAGSYDGIGAYDRAEAYAHQALALTTAAEGPGPHVGLIDLTLARIMRHSKRLAEAGYYASDALRQLPRGATEQRIDALLIRASSRYRAGRVQVAQADVDLVLQLAAKLPARQQLKWRAAGEHEAAMIALAQGQMSRAESLLARAVADFEQAEGPDSAHAIAAEEYRSMLQFHTGHEAQGATLLDDVLRRTRARYGPRSAQVADVLDLEVFVSADRGHLRVARAAAAEALSITRSIPALGALMIGDRLKEAGNTLRWSGDLRNAEADYAEAARVYPQAAGNTATNGADTLAFIRASVQGERGDPAAITLLQGILERWRHSGHLITLVDRAEVAFAMEAAGRPEQALTYLHSLEPYARTPDRRKTLRFWECQALFNAGRYAEAAPLAAAAQVWYRSGGADDRRTATTAQLLRGWIVLRQGHAAQGLPDIEAALAWRQREMGEDSYLTAAAHLAHAEALAALGRAAAARREHAAAHAVLVRMLEPSHILLQPAAASAGGHGLTRS